MKFSEYFKELLTEAKFVDSKHNELLYRFPMFTVFKDIDFDGVLNPHLIEKAFTEARFQIIKLGFPAMHVNVVLKNQRDMRMSAAGLARAKRRYMIISYDAVKNNLDFFVKVIVHEWAHLWERGRRKELKNAIDDYYNTLVNEYDKKLRRSDKLWNNYQRNNMIRDIEHMKEVVDWVDIYGMINSREMWATGIDQFLKLNPKHRKEILRLMEIR